MPHNRYCFALYNLLQLLNEKRRKVYDSFFYLPSTTLSLRSRGGEFELGYFSQPLLPFGLILAIFRSDMEKTMERAAPWIEMIFSEKNRQIPGRVLMFDSERKKYFEKRNNVIQKYTSRGSIWQRRCPFHQWDICLLQVTISIPHLWVFKKHDGWGIRHQRHTTQLDGKIYTGL